MVSRVWSVGSTDPGQTFTQPGRLRTIENKLSLVSLVRQAGAGLVVVSLHLQEKTIYNYEH